MVASSALYELAMNPDIQETLRQEIDRDFCSTADSEFNTLCSLQYLDKVIQGIVKKFIITFR